MLDLSDVFGVQGALLALHLTPVAQDGVDGPLTQGKVKEFQAANGLSGKGRSTTRTPGPRSSPSSPHEASSRPAPDLRADSYGTDKGQAHRRSRKGTSS